MNLQARRDEVYNSSTWVCYSNFSIHGVIILPTFCLLVRYGNSGQLFTQVRVKVSQTNIIQSLFAIYCHTQMKHIHTQIKYCNLAIVYLVVHNNLAKRIHQENLGNCLIHRRVHFDILHWNHNHLHLLHIDIQKYKNLHLLIWVHNSNLC